MGLHSEAHLDRRYIEMVRLLLSKSTIAPVRRGVNFVGYRTWTSRRFVRKHALSTFRRAARRGRLDAVVSSLGHARRTASLRHMIHHLQEHHHALYRQLPESVRRHHHLPARPA